MNEQHAQVLHAGRLGPDGQRGVVVRYPRSLDYFRRSLARIAGADGSADDPAARLLAMAQRLLRPEAEPSAQAALPATQSRGA